MKFTLPMLMACSLGLCLSAHAQIVLNPSGTNDRTAEINAKLNEAKAAGTYLMLNSGTYRHSDQIIIDGNVELRGNNDATLLLATTETNSAVKLTGNGPKLRNIRVRSTYSGSIVANSPNRLQSDISTLVWIKSATAFVVQGVTAQNGRSSGMMVNGSQGASLNSKAQITNNRVSNTLADGIHITNGSKWILVQSNTNSNNCDDGIGIVSKFSNPATCQDIGINNNRVSDGLWGRGITVVGGQNVSITNNIINRAHGHGLYIVAESAYDTRAVSNITANNNTMTDPNYGNKSGHNGITISGYTSSNGTFTASNITVTNCTVNNATGRGVSIGNFANNITLDGVKINGCTSAGIYLSGTATPTSRPSNVTVTGATGATKTSWVKNAGQQGVSVAQAQGSIQIKNTLFEQIGTVSGSSSRVILVSANPSATVTITGNHYTNPASPGPARYIEVSGSTPYTTPISPANTKTTTTPSSPTIFSP